MGPRLQHRGIAKNLLIFAVAAATTSLLFINWCDLVYRCGCRSLWNGAAVACNIHTPGVAHCPWCVGSAGDISYGLILLTQAIISFWPGTLPATQRLLWALLAFPVVGGIAALAFGWASGYWSS